MTKKAYSFINFNNTYLYNKVKTYSNYREE